MSAAPLTRPRPLHEAWQWQEVGLCRGMDAERFFTEDHDHGQQRRASRTREAKELCARCPVARACLEHALAVPETYGIWGGATASERVQMRVRRSG